MHAARIAELLEPFLGTANDQRLTTDDLSRISTYIDLLLRWNARINLTAVRNPEEIVTRHFGESFFAARCLFPTTAHVGTAALGCPAERSSAATAYSQTVADLGSGAGFPGIPLKLWAPAISLTLIESNHKKTTFLREVIRTLTLTDVNVFAGRAEQFSPASPTTSPKSAHNVHPGFNLVTLRAVEHFVDVLPVAAHLVHPGGHLALLIGASQLDQAQTLLPHFKWEDPMPIPMSRSRALLIAHRDSTPSRQ